MAEEAVSSADPRNALKLKHPEPEVSSEQPWQDDTLDRAQIAEKLTNLIRYQQDSFVISIDGQWGTGKTFLLKRWQIGLEKEGFSAVYYNAWEDDFCDDPLLSIVGQLSEQFRDKIDEDIACQIVKAAVQLLDKSALIALTQAMGVEVKVYDATRNLLEEYRNKNKTKADLKKYLTEMSSKVFKETRHPMIFIIDELDRCRPTFAIELMERVKHIFDVPNLVFIFGINRNELCKSLQSIYGDIEATVYLRRFFDMEFTLPSIDSEHFCRSIMAKFGLAEFFRSQSVSAKSNQHSDDFSDLSEGFPVLCESFNFSLRDIVYCVGLIALAGRNLSENQMMFPWLLGLLIPLKLRNPALFRQFILGERRASEVMDYLYEETFLPTADPHFDDWLTMMEAYLYLSERQDSRLTRELPVLGQLMLLQQGEKLTHPEILSKRIRGAGTGTIDMLIGIIESEIGPRLRRGMLDHLVGLFDLPQLLRR